MKPSDFTAESSGRCVKSTRNYYAFIPNPLPPKLEPDWALSKLISAADRALSELSGISKHLPNPQLLIPSSIKREAVLSSRIENTQAGMEDLFAYELDESNQQTADVKEVSNYVDALLYGLK